MGLSDHVVQAYAHVTCMRVWVRASACCVAGAGSSSGPAATTEAVDAAWLQRSAGLLVGCV